jgi:hypothetical protein
MSHKDKRRFYNLLPSIYHQQDIEQQTANHHRPLQDLTDILEETLKTLEYDIEGLYENWFIETCNEWVAPYIGDLVNATLLRPAKETTISSKAYIANTIHYRKRKGTVAILEKIARDVTGWDAHVVEFFQLLSTTQNINHIRPENQCTPCIVDPELMDRVGGAFDLIPHTLDVRSIKTGQGYYNVDNLGIFLWRLAAYPVKRAHAFWHEEGKYSFSSIGIDLPLFNNPLGQCNDGLLEEINLSIPIRREAAKKYLKQYYGENRSILLETEDETGVIKPISAQQIIICDLSDINGTKNWNTPIGDSDCSSKKVAIDPLLGRIMFLEKTSIERRVLVSYYYGFSADMGGGFYQRNLFESSLDDIKKYLISTVALCSTSKHVSSIGEALDCWKCDGAPNALFEIVDSGTYSENIPKIDIPPGKTLILRSTQQQRATLSAAKQNPEIHTIKVFGGEGSCLILDGLLLNQNLQLKIIKNDSKLGDSNLKHLAIHHCTLTPTMTSDGRNSLVVEGNDYLTVTLNKTISGKISMRDSLSQLILKDSIIDRGQFIPKDFSVNSDLTTFTVQCFEAHIENSTIFGKSCFDILNFASNTIFTDTVHVKRRQEGCVRFSYIPPRSEQGNSASKMPRHYHCQPENENSSVIPCFTSEKYGSPGYAQLHRCSMKEISEGADNDSELGAFNQTYQSHRLNNLRATFAEYLPFGLRAGIILVT